MFAVINGADLRPGQECAPFLGRRTADHACASMNKSGRRELGWGVSDDWRVSQMWCVVEVTEPRNQTTGHWNGTCMRCGHGTYTGFSSVEHDGPCQQTRQ